MKNFCPLESSDFQTPKLIRNKYIPYGIERISDCFSFYGQTFQKIIKGDQKKKFLNYLSKKQEDWLKPEEDPRKVLGIRHETYSEEKSHISSVGHFRGFIAIKCFLDLEGVDPLCVAVFYGTG